MRPAIERSTGLLARFVRHRNAANLLMILLILFGTWGVAQLNRQIMPTVETQMVNISISWSGASAADVTENILQPIEPAVRFLDGVTRMSSRAFEGRAQIQLFFESSTNMQDAVDRVQQAVDAVPNLPESAEDPSVQEQKFFDPVASVGISGPFSETVLRRYARTIRDGLLDKGVDRVEMTGYRDREILITADDARLRQLDLTLNDISTAINANIADQPSGSLPGEFNAQIRAVARDVTAHDLAATEIRSDAAGNALTVGDVATVEDTYAEGQGVGYLRGEPGIRLRVSRSADDDTIEVYETIKSYVEEVRPILPATLNIVVFDAAAELVDDRLWLLISNGALGLILVLVILFVFLDFRIAFWVAVGIPVSILATLGIMFLTGQTLDMISMFALMMTLGIIVDDAIVVGEHTATRYAMGDSRSDAAINGAGRMAAPVIAASLTTMAAFGPLLMIEGFVGAFMSAIPMVVMAVLVASLVECFLILPGHLAHTLPKERRRPWWFRRHFDRGFAFFRDRMFGWFSDLTYRWRYVTVSAALGVAMIVGALVPSGMIGFQFFPSVEGEVIRLSAQFQPGIPEERMAGIMTDFETVVSGIETDLAPDGEKLFVTTYASLDVADSNAWLEVYLTPSEERSVRSDAIRSAIEEAVPSIAGVERMNVREFRGGPPSRAIDIALSGGDIATLKQASEDVQEVLEGFPGINSLSDTLSYGSPEMTMTLTDRGAALGFDLNSLGTQIRDAFEGRTVRRVAAGEEEIAIRLQRGSEASGSDALRSLWVRAPSGGFVPISSVVSFGEEQTFRRIFREDGKTTINVQADVDEGAADTDELVAQLDASYLPEIAGRYGITYSFEGTQADQEDAFADLRLGAFVALGVMYIIIAWIFASYTAPLAVMLIIPFGVVGAIWGHYVMGFDLTFISAMGLLGLSGILVNDSIVLISRLQDRLAEGDSLREAATGAARDRLRAVLLTSLTTIGGLTPILFETSLQAQLLIPMAITIVFGLGVATALVLFIVPAFMGIGADVGALLRWIFLTPGAPSFRELIAGAHHDRPRSPEAAE